MVGVAGRLGYVCGQPADGGELLGAVQRPGIGEDLDPDVVVVALDVGDGAFVDFAGEDEQVVDHAGRIFRVWRERLASLLVEGGCPAAQAPALAALTIAAMEGAVAMARAEDDLRPFELAARQLLDVVPTV